jgi:hypothetical protein
VSGPERLRHASHVSNMQAYILGKLSSTGTLEGRGERESRYIFYICPRDHDVRDRTMIYGKAPTLRFREIELSRIWT